LIKNLFFVDSFGSKSIKYNFIFRIDQESRKTKMSTALKRLMTEYKQLTANEDEDSMFTAG
jgi:hypothetical protein